MNEQIKTDAVRPTCPSRIPLGNDRVALVSAQDFTEMSGYTWHARTGRSGAYAMRDNGRGERIYMHRQIMECPDGMEVDHINHDTLDNRRENLRVVTKSQNKMNMKKGSGDTSSRFKGVFRNNEEGSWTVQIKDKGRVRNFTGLASEEIAARVYDLVALDRFGEHACLNFPESARPLDFPAGAVEPSSKDAFDIIGKLWVGAEIRPTTSIIQQALGEWERMRAVRAPARPAVAGVEIPPVPQDEYERMVSSALHEEGETGYPRIQAGMDLMFMWCQSHLRPAAPVAMTLSDNERCKIIRDSRIAAIEAIHKSHGVDSLADIWLNAFDLVAETALRHAVNLLNGGKA